MDCPICEKHRYPTDTIYESKNWVITPGPLASQILGYVYIEPKRHVENWAQFTNDEIYELGLLIKNVEAALIEILHVDRLYAVTISEAVRHLHVHVIPREQGMDVKGLPLIEQATQQKVKTEKQINEDQLKWFTNQLKNYFGLATSCKG